MSEPPSIPSCSKPTDTIVVKRKKSSGKEHFETKATLLRDHGLDIFLLARSSGNPNVCIDGLGNGLSVPGLGLLTLYWFPAYWRHGGDVHAHEHISHRSLVESAFRHASPDTINHIPYRWRLSMNHKVVSSEQWLLARKQHLANEVEMTKALDVLRTERRNLPWLRVEKSYVFDGTDGRCSLVDLFGSRSQLAIYNFMLSPDSDHVCPGCSFIMDHVDSARQHFEHADLSFTAVSRASVQQIKEVKDRMGWGFKWVSSANNSFNYDFGVSFLENDRDNGTALYNYGKTQIQKTTDMFGISIFVRNDAGEIFHTYSTYHRGIELLIGAFNWLDLTPKGRNEEGTMSWVRLHDQYAVE